MKHNLALLKQYIPWLLIIFAVEGFTAILLWIADIRIFRALLLLLMMTTVFIFLITSWVLIIKEKKKEKAFIEFLRNPDKDNEKNLINMSGSAKTQLIKKISEVLNRHISERNSVNTQLEDYEEYVELWAHEIKVPLSLLTLILDNREAYLSPELAYKLDYIRNRIQENILHILFYYRIKSERKDYFFENVNLKKSIEEVLKDYSPLLKEKNFDISLHISDSLVFTDRRSLEFILSQLVCNAIKHCKENPELEIRLFETGDKKYLSVRDNGTGVKQCDLPYIFEKSFTGDSGHTRKESTGMGLYLVEQIARDINVEVKAISQWNEYFEIVVYF